MKHRSKRFLSILLSLVLVLGLLPGMSLTAYADPPTSSNLGTLVGNVPTTTPAYLTFTGTDAFSIEVSSKGWNGTLEYSTNGSTWTEWNGTAIHSADNVLYLRGTSNTTITNGYNAKRLVITTENNGTVACRGDIRTLLDYSNPETATMGQYCFAYLFYGCTSLTAAPDLPATALTYYCYQEMFCGCTSLTAAPALPAEILAPNCYQGMFYGCTRS